MKNQVDKDQEELIRILEANGRHFLKYFGPSLSEGKRKEDPSVLDSSARKRAKHEHHSDDGISDTGEWQGIADSDGSGSDNLNMSEEDTDNTSDVDDDEDSNVQTRRAPAVVVFSEKTGSSTTSTQPSRAQLKAFMSSKVEKLRKDVPLEEDGDSSDDDGEDEATNMQNDKLLHRLVHTKLLSGSLNEELDLTPAQRRKALAGRVLEAAGKTKLGKGENAVRSAERNKAAKHIRDGLQAKQKERNEKKLEEAKNMGNYHPALKSLFEDSEAKSGKKRRERGLKLGVGSFSGGVLKLRKSDIAAVAGGSSSRGRGRGRGGKGGRRGRR